MLTKKCKFCQSADIRKVIDLGSQSLGGVFFKKKKT